jgi:hypothetical protein
MSTTMAARTPRGLSLPQAVGGVAAAVLVALLAAAGGWLAILALAGGDGHQHPASVGEAIPTSFGSLTVQPAQTLDGLTPEDLGGVTHGVNNLVLSDSAQVEVSFLLVNAGDSGAAIDPDQFRLVVGGARDALAPTGSTMRPMTLAAGARVGASVTFVVPRTGAQMELRYADPGSSAPVSIPMGRLDQAPADAASPHTH